MTNAKKPTAAQSKLLLAAAARSDGHVIGGSKVTRQNLREAGWVEIYGYHYGPLKCLTVSGRAAAQSKK